MEEKWVEWREEEREEIGEWRGCSLALFLCGLRAAGCRTAPQRKREQREKNSPTTIPFFLFLSLINGRESNQSNKACGALFDLICSLPSSFHVVGYGWGPSPLPQRNSTPINSLNWFPFHPFWLHWVDWKKKKGFIDWWVAFFSFS